MTRTRISIMIDALKRLFFNTLNNTVKSSIIMYHSGNTLKSNVILRGDGCESYSVLVNKRNDDTEDEGS
jgi:hypothetical protein